MFQDKTCSSFAQGSKSYGKLAVIDPLRSEKQDPKYVYTVVQNKYFAKKIAKLKS